MPRHMKASPEPCLRSWHPIGRMASSRSHGLFTGSWRADLCTQEGVPFVLGQALYMKAIHGGKAKNDTIDAHAMAVLLRGGMLPQASGSPAEMRATRDLRRRRMSRCATRGPADAFQNPNRQSNVPRSARSSPTKPTAPASLSASPTRWPETHRSGPQAARRRPPAHRYRALSLRPRRRLRPKSSTACARSLGSARSWPLSCAMPSITSSASSGTGVRLLLPPRQCARESAGKR